MMEYTTTFIQNQKGESPEMETPLPGTVARAVRGYRPTQEYADLLGISVRTLGRIEERGAEHTGLLYANAYIGAEMRAGNWRNVAFLLETTGTRSAFESRHPILPRWEHADEGSGVIARW